MPFILKLIEYNIWEVIKMAEISEELKRKLFEGGPEKVVRREQQSW